MKQNALLAMLAGGDRRSIGRSVEVAAEVLANPLLFKAIVRGMSSDDPIIRMRAADAAEKITLHNPGLLQAHRKTLLRIARSDQQEVRWHMAQLFSRVTWTRSERKTILSILQDYLKDKSSIVRTFAMQALADQAEQDRTLRTSIVKQIRMLVDSGTPAMKSRGKKLLERLSRS